MSKFITEEERQIVRLNRLIEYYDFIFNYCNEKKIKPYSDVYRNVVLFILSNDINEIAKSILRLYEGNSRIGIDSLNRMAFEKYIFVLLTKNSETKSKAYIHKLKIRNYEHVSNLLYDEEYANSFSKLSGLEINMVKKELLKKYPNFDADKVKLFNEYCSCYNYEINENHVFNHKWYNFSKKANSIKKLAEEVGLFDEFRILYDINSSEVHSLVLNEYYKFINEDDKSYIAVLNQDINSNDISGIVFISTKIYHIILIFFDVYKVPKKIRMEFNKKISETINLARHIKVK